jgi:Ca-activated chloride channel family protein
MRQDNRMGQVKEAVRGLISLFRDIDAISLMTFNTQSRLWLELVPGNEKNRLFPRVDSLSPAGQTNGLAALHQAFDLAGKGYISGGENRVVLITDGQFALSQELKTRLMQEKRKGIELLVIGFGSEQDRGVLALQKLAEAVQGRFLRFAPGQGQEKNLVEFIRQASRK